MYLQTKALLTSLTEKIFFPNYKYLNQTATADAQLELTGYLNAPYTGMPVVFPQNFEVVHTMENTENDDSLTKSMTVQQLIFNIKDIKKSVHLKAKQSDYGEYIPITLENNDVFYLLGDLDYTTEYGIFNKTYTSHWHFNSVAQLLNDIKDEVQKLKPKQQSETTPLPYPLVVQEETRKF